MGAELMSGEKAPSLLDSVSVNQTAWATGVLIFDKTPLPVVLKDLSDFYHLQLSSEECEKKLTGEFFTDSPDKIIDMIEDVLQVKIQKK